MTGFILAAGFGTRLRPLSEHIPKALVPVCGIPLIFHTGEYLKQQGFSRIGANAHYRADTLQQYVSTLKYPIDLFLEKDAILGTGGGLYNARDYLSQEPWFCVHNVDIISTANLRRISDALMESENIATLIAAPRIKDGTVAFEADTGHYAGVVSETAIPENCLTADFTGVALYKKEFLDFLTSEDFSIVPVWKRACEAGRKVTVTVEHGIYWKDIGNPQSLLQIHFDVLDGQCQLDINEKLYVDWEQKKAYPALLNAGLQNSIGPYVWSNSVELSATAHVQRSLILSGARVAESENISHTVITEWGNISVE